MGAASKTSVQSLLREIEKAGSALSHDDPASSETLLIMAHSLADGVELPSESIQRIGWAEASLPSMYWFKGLWVRERNHIELNER